MTDSRAPRPGPGPVHPNDESLIAYVTGTLAVGERAEIERHVRTCDDCVRTLTMMQRRLGMIDEFAAAVPVGVADRALRSMPAEAQRERRIGGLDTWLATIRDKLASILRFPVLVPVAVAAVAVLVVVTHESWSPAPGELTRSTQIHQRLRVTAPEAVLRAQPSRKERVIAVLKRGTDVEIVGGRGEWLQVHVEGKEGWMERQAFD